MYVAIFSWPWRRSLTMSNQKSEMKAQYCGQQEMIDRIIPITDPQPSLLTDHHEEGVTKVALIRPLCTVHSISYFPFLLLASLPHLNYYHLIPDLSPYICISLFSHSCTHSFSPSLLLNLSLFSSLQFSLTLFSHPPSPPSRFTLSFHLPFSL